MVAACGLFPWAIAGAKPVPMAIVGVQVALGFGLADHFWLVSLGVVRAVAQFEQFHRTKTIERIKSLSVL